MSVYDRSFVFVTKDCICVLLNVILHMYLPTITHYYVICDCAYIPAYSQHAYSFFVIMNMVVVQTYISLWYGLVMVTTTVAYSLCTMLVQWMDGSFVVIPSTCLSSHCFVS